MIVFRADGGREIGAGHIMRCLSLAGALRAAGEACRFLLADDGMAEAVRSAGLDFDVLGTDPAADLAELPVLRPFLCAASPRLVVADSYALTDGWVRAVREVCPVAIVDDLGQFSSSADFLINYNLTALDLAAGYRAAAQRGVKLLLGPGYAPLRPQFCGLPVRKVKRAAADILVSTGGADPENLALGLLRALAGRNFGALRWHFVVGALNPHRSELERLAAGLPGVELHSNVQDMAGLMLRCDVALSAAGSTLYELCAAGLPTVTYTLADNQLPGAAAFAARGLMVNAGDCRSVGGFPEVLLREVEGLCLDFARRKRQAAEMQTLVDGGGAARVAAALR